MMMMGRKRRRTIEMTLVCKLSWWHIRYISVFGQFDNYFRYRFDQLSRDRPTMFPWFSHGSKISPFFLPGPAGHGSEGHGDTGGSHLSWLGNLSAPIWMAGASISIDFFGWEVKQFIGSQWKFHFCQSCGFGWNLACNGKKSLIHPLGALLVRLGSHRWLSLIHWITGIMFKNVQNSWFL